MDKHSEYLSKFMKLAEAGEFYLRESFDYLHRCLESELAETLFKELLLLVEHSDEDDEIMKGVEFSDDIIQTLSETPPEVLSNKTHSKIDYAWSTAQKLGNMLGHNFKKSTELDSIEILGHLNNYAFFFETLVNRHLLFLFVSNKIDQFTYTNLNRAKILTRLTYIFKDDLVNNKVQLNEVSNLFSLRNKTVHFTPDNAIKISSRIDELIRIWNQTKNILGHFQKIENFNETKFSNLIESEATEFKKRWLNPENKHAENFINKVKEKVNSKRKDDD